MFLFFYTVQKIIVDYILIRHTCFVCHILKIFNHLIVKANCNLFFESVCIRIFYPI